MTSPDFWLAPREVLTEERRRPLREFEERKRLAEAADTEKQKERAAAEKRRARAAESRLRAALDRVEGLALTRKERAVVAAMRALVKERM